MLITILFGALGTLAVAFLADVMLASLSSPSGVAGVEAVAMSEDAELHHWIGYKVAVAGVNDKEVLHHVGKAYALATNASQKMALDGIVVEHLPAGHFIHTKNILKELLGDRPEPAQPLEQLEAKLASALIKQKNVVEAREQVEHLVAVTSGKSKEVGERTLEALQKADEELAGRLLAELAGD